MENVDLRSAMPKLGVASHVIKVSEDPIRTNCQSWSRLGPQIKSKWAPLETGAPCNPSTAEPPWLDAPVSKNPSYVYGRY